MNVNRRTVLSGLSSGALLSQASTIALLSSTRSLAQGVGSPSLIEALKNALGREEDEQRIPGVSAHVRKSAGLDEFGYSSMPSDLGIILRAVEREASLLAKSDAASFGARRPLPIASRPHLAGNIGHRYGAMMSGS